MSVERAREHHLYGEVPTACIVLPRSPCSVFLGHCTKRVTSSERFLGTLRNSAKTAQGRAPKSQLTRDVMSISGCRTLEQQADTPQRGKLRENRDE